MRGGFPGSSDDLFFHCLLDGFARLERDLHRHVHKENNVLFPRAIAMEADKAG